MPAPVNANELLDLIQRSGVADEPKLRAYIQKLTAGAGVPTDPQKLAGLLIRDGLLTYFQAEQILQGKYKRFTIGKYKVLEKIGAGGMAQVFLCEHKLMRRRVAIKVLPSAKANDQASRDRFYREARAVAAVDHPNIVRAYDIDQDENLHFLVMEYVDGTNLQDLIKKFGPLDITRACHYIYGSAVGLQHAHEMGLIHRDIKPGNILIDRSGVVKILDLGLARFFHDDDDQLTRNNDENILGTADYLAPEQAMDSHTVDIRADIYSLGATFYYLLTGSVLFPEGSVPQKLIWQQNRQPAPVRSLRPEVPPELVAVVDQMLAKDPAKRFPTPNDVLAALAPWVTTSIPPPAEKEMPPVSPAAGGRGPVSIASTAVQAAAVALPRISDRGTLLAPVAAVAPVITLAPQATPAPFPVDNPAVWESLDNATDTQNLDEGDTDRPVSSAPLSSRRRHAAPVPGGASRFKLYTVLGLLLVAGSACGVYFAFFDKPTPEPIGPQTGPRTLTVTKTSGDHMYPTLRDALSRANAGDTILITEQRLSESNLKIDRTRHKDLTIKGATPDGKPPIIEASTGGRPILDAESVEGFSLRNVEFDGANRVDVAVQISAVCPGLQIENVTVRNVKSVGFRLSNASGGEGHTIVLDRVRVVVNAPTQTGIQLLASSNADSRRIVIRNSRFEGLTAGGVGTGIRIDGPASELEITGNRLFNLDAAFLFAKVPAGKVLKGQITSNTVYGSKAGLHFDTTPPVPNQPFGNLAVTVANNYFAKTGEIGKAVGPTPPAGPTPIDNAQSESGNGNFALNPVAVPNNPQLPAPDPNTDATFLRFPSGPPEIGPGKKVGAP